MSKYYKYILSIYILLGIFIITYCLIPKNPFRYSGDEITLKEESSNFKEYDFTNYELNYINHYHLENKIIMGRQISYYKYNERWVELSDGFYHRKKMDDGVLMNSYYFVEQNVVLVKIQIPFKLFIKNQYFINVTEHEVLEWNTSYKYNDKEYDITNIRQNFKKGLFEIVNAYSTKVSLENPIINVSFFLKPTEDNQKKSLVFELYQKEQIKKYKLTIGLNTLKDEKISDSVFVLSNYLERGGE